MLRHSPVLRADHDLRKARLRAKADAALARIREHIAARFKAKPWEDGTPTLHIDQHPHDPFMFAIRLEVPGHPDFVIALEA